MPWTQLSPATSPSSRIDFGFAYDKVRKESVLFGGASWTTYLGPATFNLETWTFNGVTWTQKTPATNPDPYGGSGNFYQMAWDDVNQGILMWYVTANDATPAHTWKTAFWDGTDWTILSTNTPATYPSGFIHYHAQGAGWCEAPGIGNIILINGNDTGSAVQETYHWDGSVYAELFPTNPSLRYSNSFAAYDGTNHRVIKFGGTRAAAVSQSTEMWDGSDWSLVSTTLAAGHDGPGSSFGYGKEYGLGMHFGGQLSNDNNHTYLWHNDISDWTHSLDSPRPSSSPNDMTKRLIYDEDKYKWFLFGGVTEITPFPTLAETWEYIPDSGLYVPTLPSAHFGYYKDGYWHLVEDAII